MNDMNKMQRDNYLKQTMQTVPPAQLLIMLYDGAIRFTKLAIESIEQKKMVEAHLNIVKVQDIVQEFIITLDRKAPVAEGLLKLYDYFFYLLVQANIKKDTKNLQEVLGYLTELIETWVQAARLALQTTNVGEKHG
jgi:flagellar protein FliS